MSNAVTGKQFFDHITRRALSAAEHRTMHHASCAEARATTLDEVVVLLRVAAKTGGSLADITAHIEGLRKTAQAEHVARVEKMQATLGIKIM